MNGLNRHLLRLGLIVTGSAMLVSPIRRHRAIWHVTVGDKSARSRVLHGGEYGPSVRVLFNALRSGERRPDAEFRSAVALVLIGSGLGLSPTQASNRSHAWVPIRWLLVTVRPKTESGQGFPHGDGVKKGHLTRVFTTSCPRSSGDRAPVS